MNVYTSYQNKKQAPKPNRNGYLEWLAGKRSSRAQITEPIACSHEAAERRCHATSNGGVQNIVTHPQIHDSIELRIEDNSGSDEGVSRQGCELGCVKRQHTWKLYSS